MMQKPALKLGLVIAGFLLLLPLDVTAQAATTELTPRPRAQQVQPAPALGTAALNRLISVRLQNVTLEGALAEIEKQGGVQLLYGGRVVPLDRRVELVTERITVFDALRHVLQGTGVVIQALPTGKIMLVRGAGGGASGSADDSTGTIRGQVTDSTTGERVAGARIRVGETNIIAVSDAEGNFVLTRVPAGQRVITVRRLGYAPKEQQVQVDTGQAYALANFALTPVATRLSEMVTTGSGDRSRLEVGNSIATINVDSVMRTAPIRNVSDLLSNRVLGLLATPGVGDAGAPTRLRVRGLTSITSSNDPIFILDGVRMASNFTRCPGAAAENGCLSTASRIDDINPNDIATIEVLKGPSAATLYGSDAANGVIVIKTKRGRAGPPRWDLHASHGITQAPTDYPAPINGMGTSVNGNGAAIQCPLVPNSLGYSQADGTCVPFPNDSIVGGFNELGNSLTTSLETGRLSTVGGSVSGGAGSLQYYLSGDYSDEVGVAKLPEINRRLIEAFTGGSLPSWQTRPNAITRINTNARLTGQLGSKADFSVGAGLVRLDQRNGNSAPLSGINGIRSASDTVTPVSGWRDFHLRRENEVTRFITNAAVNWYPTAWFRGTVSVGRDFNQSYARDLALRDGCVPICRVGSETGDITTVDATTAVQSLDLRGTTTLPIVRWLTSRTAFGGQYAETRTKSTRAAASDLAGGGSSFRDAASHSRTDVTGDERATAGVYIDQSLIFNDRLFLTGAVRVDVGSALGSDVAPIYPKWSASWLLSEEPFFPWKELANLRLRAAYGQAGIQPGSAAKYRLYAQSITFVNPDGSLGSRTGISSIGNRDLLPERTAEYEGGFELGLWNDRIVADFTAFRKLTKDAVLNRPLSPSLGFPPGTTQPYNIGNVRNTGLEASVRAQVLRTEPVSWGVSVGYASHRNELTKLGPNIKSTQTQIGNTLSTLFGVSGDVVREGYPLHGRWARPILGYSDINGDGIIGPTEVLVGDSLVYVGAPDPKYNLQIHNDVGLWNDRLYLSADFQYVHGLVQQNDNAFRTRGVVPASYSRSTPLDVQACFAALARPLTSASAACFFEKVNWLRFTTFSVGYTVPESVARLARARSVTIRLQAANLALWTDYNGQDPATNSADPSGTQYANGSVVPQPRTWSLSVAVGY